MSPTKKNDYDSPILFSFLQKSFIIFHNSAF